MRPDLPATAWLDVQAVKRNVERVREATGVKVMAVVKANAYGHGDVQVARAARDAGAEWLGVAFTAEAVSLRRAGDRGRMLAWIHTAGDPLLFEALALDVDVSVSAQDQLEYVAAAARHAGSRARVHLKVDTGLGRAGAMPDQWPSLVAAALKCSDVEVVGLWSHLACSDEPESPVTQQQKAAFAAAVHEAEALGARECLRHLANSGAALCDPQSRWDMVRTGIAIYGLSPGRAVGRSADLGLTPALQLRSSVVQVKVVPAGHGASYGLTWRAPVETRLALVPLGYADGLPRSAVGAQVLIGGRRFPIVGRIAMDQVIVDVGPDGAAPGAPVAVGDDVVVFGSGVDGEPTVSEWADWAGTIDYEIVTRIGPRVQRAELPQ